MVTARDAVTDIVSGLDAGAEDYLTKPFSFLELSGATAVADPKTRSPATRVEGGRSDDEYRIA